eukprot:NODE_2210_length_1249_cov_224.685383_g2099_i0.p1 GENE.NODE_2210_length_1249_cov_224.685383_g2099_i0~~NODE_2210_length_1249_cov_224.685383_g2099_i0.p1  ORF type:complete len:386 (-),score=101.61 NODE_2210_length_1249_cov_224.685383_g2099_i0:92-1201(-)
MAYRLVLDIIAVLCGCLAYRIFYGNQIEPISWDSPSLPDLPPNTALVGAEHLFTNQIVGPEAFATDAAGLLYSGLADGRIVKFEENGLVLQNFTRLGPQLPGCGSYEMEPICGRPLGMQWYRGVLYVADAYKGLVRIGPDGQVVPMATQAEGQPFVLLNSLTIFDEVIYLTDSSSRWTRRDVLLECMEAHPTGRLIAYDLRTNVVQVLARDLPFPNGLVLTHDRTELLIVLTMQARLLAYNLDTHALRPFVTNLPGIPDNIVAHPSKPVYLIGMNSKRSTPFSFIHFAADKPLIRKLLTRLMPTAWITRLLPTYGLVLMLDTEGRVAGTFQDPTGHTGWISEPYFTRRSVFLGSWKNPFLGRVDRAVFD